LAATKGSVINVEALGVVVLKAYSKICVELVSADCVVSPRLRFNLLLDDRRDFVRPIGGLSLALQPLGDDEVLRIFPSGPSAATHLSVLVVAEKMADQIKTEWLHGSAGGVYAA
jgi:hypothetical protein